MSFGFSAGDFVSALNLVGAVVNALRDSGGAFSEYRELIKELYSLETALLSVKRLELKEEQRSEYTSLRYAAAQCQTTIDAFWKRIEKYQKHLTSAGKKSVVDCWMKVRWSLCKKEDLARFKADVAAHTMSIQLLLDTIQMRELGLQDGKRQNEHKTLLGTIQQLSVQCMGKFVSMSAKLNIGITQGARLIETTARILHTNIQIFQMICAIQNILTRIPNQIDRQQPVYMIDALGRASPFCLEFIRSSEALTAVLKANFTKIPSGRRKIEDGEFVIQDIGTKREINLEDDWELCFNPGQRVQMRMVFRRRSVLERNPCPNCDATCDGLTGDDVVCSRCGLGFSRVIELEEAAGVVKDVAKATRNRLMPRKARRHRLRPGNDTLDGYVGGWRELSPIAFDESEDIRFYRSIKVLERKRREIQNPRNLERPDDKAFQALLALLAPCIDPDIFKLYLEVEGLYEITGTLKKVETSLKDLEGAIPEGCRNLLTSLQTSRNRLDVVEVEDLATSAWLAVYMIGFSRLNSFLRRIMNYGKENEGKFQFSEEGINIHATALSELRNLHKDTMEEYTLVTSKLYTFYRYYNDPLFYHNVWDGPASRNFLRAAISKKERLVLACRYLKECR